ncbi:hypothetical protein CJ030_MR5G023711 [Morella rubra]|uniref:Ubiquitin-like domain-containing protein n=1 Tax=Morella rubra TaxID=262757 RepID=A0A6A1VGV0_9ROSI|nr:hypothetical protein CJ030_MR5G023711 [Morella rubra]
MAKEERHPASSSASRHMLMQDKSNGVIFGWNSSDKKHRRLKKERGSGGGAERKPKIDSYNLPLPPASSFWLTLEVGGVASVVAMYIRVKRSKTTYFIRCDPTETILEIKEKLHVLIDQPVNNQRLILVGTQEVLEDSKTLADQKVENDAVVALTLRKDDNEFEEVDIARPNDFYQTRDADGGNW